MKDILSHLIKYIRAGLTNISIRPVSTLSSSGKRANERKILTKRRVLIYSIRFLVSRKRILKHFLFYYSYSWIKYNVMFNNVNIQ